MGGLLQPATGEELYYMLWNNLDDTKHKEETRPADMVNFQVYFSGVWVLGFRQGKGDKEACWSAGELVACRRVLRRFVRTAFVQLAIYLLRIC